MRPREFCNLTEAVVRSDDTISSLTKKVELATILGTWQSTLTNFRYLGSKWKTNCEEERLLGVSLTGIMDSTLTNGLNDKNLPHLLTKLKEKAVKTNKEQALELGINPSASFGLNTKLARLSPLKKRNGSLLVHMYSTTLIAYLGYPFYHILTISISKLHTQSVLKKSLIL